MATASCVHCGRSCDSFERGHALILGQPVCHPQQPDEGRDCFALVMRRRMPLGQLRRRPDQCSISELTDTGNGEILVLCQNTAIGEETVIAYGCRRDDESHEMRFRYCAEHRHHASEGAA